MIYITDKLAIDFSHGKFEEKGRTQRFTSCSIVEVTGYNDGKPIVHPTNTLGSGIAYCHKNDNFNKEIGRKLALARAISTWPREERAKVWEVYLNR